VEWRRLDLPFLLSVLVLALLGMLMIYSATGQDSAPRGEFARQAACLVVGLFLLALFSAIDYEFWGRFHWVFYLVGIGLLIAVLGAGHEAKGAQRWLSLGPLGRFQPSEPIKLLLCISLARLLAAPVDRPDHPGGHPFLPGLALTALPLLLILLQPDLGTALVLAALMLAMMYVAGIPFTWLGGLVAAGLALFPFVLRDYQRQRLFIFLNPESDPTGAGWNLIQSRIAIGSGQLWGKGLFLGTQNNLSFVPEHHTDFIFTVVGEELGLVGGLSLLILYAYLLLFGLRVAERARDRFGALLAVGIVATLGFHVLVNIGMTVGLMPITGVPLPFLSYGGSALLTNMMAAGILLSIWLRRPQPRL
jgi:rod shape determining protein RodA